MATDRESLDGSFDEGEAARRRQVIAVSLGAILLTVVVWFLFVRDGSPDQTAAVAIATVDTDSNAAPEQPNADANRSHVETFEIFAPKDPFDPLISAAPVKAAPALGTDTEVPAAATETAEPGVTESNGTTTITTSSSTDDSPSQTGHRVKVVDVFSEDGDDRAQVQVDGTVYTIDEGERFAANFELVSASKACATMLFGDDEFTLCEGEEILK